MKKLLALILFTFPVLSLAAEGASVLDLTGHWTGIVSLALFVLAYLLVMAEEFTDMKKSKPVMLAAGLIWGLIAWYYQSQGIPDVVESALRHNLEEYAELMLFLIVAMTYINTMDERLVFESLRAWLMGKGWSYRTLFWVTGLLAFFISAVADNLTTALLMAAVVIAVGRSSRQFVLLSCINLVVAANAGGAFSPFGDITTLMVWQANVHASNGIVDFWSFFRLFIPALINWFVPALFMHFWVPTEQPEGNHEKIAMKRGAPIIMALFVFTIALAVAFHSFLQLPPVMGMLTGLALLKIYAYFLKINGELTKFPDEEGMRTSGVPFDIYLKIARSEWDTLFFFYGVVMCVGGLGFLGYLAGVSHVLYGSWGATNANVAVGLISAVVDNIPVMFAVLSMMPDMSVGQWLLVTLTAGVGGSLLSIGSAAGVALMGQARGIYTFFGHLKWMPVIALGYAASIVAHMLVNRAIF
ncbi:MAG TPA: sodium:proton antiporter NhaD [Methylophilaceae bacterium]|nr:sodium:proton antiporter NhaD [Methylophilaceae bacterium]